MTLVHGAAYTIVALVLLTGVGNIACRLLFSSAGLKSETSENTGDLQPAGWIIGWLERTVLAIGIVTQSWEVLAAVIALKTVARFKELDDQRFAEYFLVGSLFSVLWAVIVTSAWLTYDRHFGFDIRTKIAGIFEITERSSGDCTQKVALVHIAELPELCSGEVPCANAAALCVHLGRGLEVEEQLPAD